MPVRLILTNGTTADCSQAIPLIEGIEAEHLLADKGYDSNEIVAAALARGIKPVIPPRSNRKEAREYDQDLYKIRHLVENAFLHLKQWRGVATRYAKRSTSFLAACHPGLGALDQIILTTPSRIELMEEHKPPKELQGYERAIIAVTKLMADFVKEKDPNAMIDWDEWAALVDGPEFQAVMDAAEEAEDALDPEVQAIVNAVCN